jgi:serine/threonine protein kinase
MLERDEGGDETREQRLGRILSELHEERAGGRLIDRAAIVAANPDLADDLRVCLDAMHDLRPAAGGVDSLIRQGLLQPSSDPAYPACLGPYKIVEVIGRGGMGVVLKARDESLNRFVAVKVLRPELAGDASVFRRFQREAKAAAALRHPNIVTVYAVGEERGVQYITMEYIEGPTLAQVLHEHGSLPAETIRFLSGQLLSGLAAAHAAGLVHRDIKSANLLLDKSPRPWSGATPNAERRPEEVANPEPVAPQSAIPNLRSAIVKIADFGLARVLTAETRLTIPQSAFGTPEYMSPEQARGDQNVDHRSDLYSAGVVLYEMLTARTPFQAETPTAVIHRILHDEPADPRELDSRVDRSLASLALRLMAKRPEDRFASAEEALAALRVGRRISLPQQWRKWRRSALLVTLVALAVAVFGWLAARALFNPSLSPDASGATAQRKIRDVRAQDGLLQVLYQGSGAWEVPAHLPTGLSFAGAALVRPGDGQDEFIVAGVSDPVGGKSVFAYDRQGREMWGLDLSDGRRWPDCQEGGLAWRCSAVLAGDLDGMSGDEIVAIGEELNQYATRVSIIDPLTRSIRATFWHMGHCRGAILVPDFFDGPRPAIVLSGLANKLDGFYEPRPDDPRDFTPYDIVSVLMILDPRQMLKHGDGLGPPRTGRVDLPEAGDMIYAYAFLDLAQSGNMAVRTGQPELLAPPEECGELQPVRQAPDQPKDGSNPWFLLFTTPKLDEFSCTITVDRDLAIRRVLITNAPPERQKVVEDHWRQRWRVIIRDSKCLDQPIADGDRASNK